MAKYSPALPGDNRGAYSRAFVCSSLKRSGWAIRRLTAAAKAAISSLGTIAPAMALATSPVAPTLSVAMTASPHCKASFTNMPQPSKRLGTMARSKRGSSATRAEEGTMPRKTIRPAKPSRLASASNLGRSGPSPKISSPQPWRGKARQAASKISTPLRSLSCPA